MMQQTPMWQRVVNGCAIVSVVLALLIIWTPLVPPSQDGASHILDTVIHSHPERFEGLVRPHAPPSARGFVVPTTLVSRAGGPVVGARVTLTLCLSLLIAGMVLLGRQRVSESGVAIIGACMVGTGWLAAMGFWNFLVGFSLGVLAVGLWWRTYRSGWAGRLSVALVLLVAVVAHVAAAALMASVLAAFSVCAVVVGDDAERPNGARRRFFVQDLVCWLPALAWSFVIATGVTSDLAAMTGSAQGLSWSAIPFAERARNLVMCAFVSWSPVAASAQVAAIGIVAAAAIIGGRRPETLMAAGCGLVAVSTLLMPLHLAGWAFAPARLLTPALLLPLAMLPRDRRAAQWLAAGFGAVAVVSLVLALGGALREGARANDARLAFSSEPAGRAFVVVYRPEPLRPAGPYIRSMVGVGNWGVMGGGAHAGQFAVMPNVHNALFERPASELFPSTPLLFLNVSAECLEDVACAARDAMRADRVAASAVAWDTVLVSEAPRSFLDQLTLRGFTPLTRGTWSPPAAASVRVRGGLGSGSSDSDDVVVVRASYPSTIGPFRAALYRPVDDWWTLDGLPAGTVTIDAFIDRDGNRRRDEGEPELLPPTQRVLVSGTTTDVELPAR